MPRLRSRTQRIFFLALRGKTPMVTLTRENNETYTYVCPDERRERLFQYVEQAPIRSFNVDRSGLNVGWEVEL
jgi:hypothetical protein